MDKIKVINEIKLFLEGYNNNNKYIVNIEADKNTNYAECVIHEPNGDKYIKKIIYEPFLYIKDLSLNGIKLYEGYDNSFISSFKIKYGINIIKLETGNQKRLNNGFCYKITSNKSFNSIIEYLNKGGLDVYKKAVDDSGRFIRDENDSYVYPYKHLVYTIKPVEQFLISTKSRLYKGYEDYNDILKLTFDIETTGLKYQKSRIISIGVRTNKGFETILEVDKNDDDISEINLIQDFFNLVNMLKPAIIVGQNSESFDYDFILGRSNLLNLDINNLKTTLKDTISLKRNNRATLKYGSNVERYTSTELWGYSVIDTLHAIKKTAAINSDIKSYGLKYIAKHEKLSKPNRTYIDGDDNRIGKFYSENKIFMISDDNKYVIIPDIYQDIARKLYLLTINKNNISESEYKSARKSYLNIDKTFVDWLKEAINNNYNKLITGKEIVKQYLLDDLWETEQVDNLYNQSSFMLAKIIPTTYSKICTMGTASIWNLILTAWSYEKNIAIPESDISEKFSGGLARCYKTGYSKRIKKVDYNSLYPMIQLTDDVFPIFDISNVIKKILLYLTTTRNIYKNIGNEKELNDEELNLLSNIDHDIHSKLINNEILKTDINRSKIKQLPIKILNNSLFGALGSGVSFNWSDNICAARITATGRLHLRHAVSWFSQYGCIPLLAVTDGINFHYPELTNIRIINDKVINENDYNDINVMWEYNGKFGMDALIKKFNTEEMKPPFMAIGDDGDAISSLNLSRINYANLVLKDDVEKIKLTGNTIKSKVMPEYVEEFIDIGLKHILHGDGKSFVDYYYNYCYDILYMQIPLKKIASKSKIKNTISAYLNRGVNKNGKKKAVQAHMELLIENRYKLAEELFNENINNLNLSKYKDIESISINDKLKLVSDYMPPEPEVDSTIYYYNNGYIKSHGNSSKIIDKETGIERFASILINNKDLIDNPNMKGKYNSIKYLSTFNKRIKPLLAGFDPNVAERILCKVNKKNEIIREVFTDDELTLKNFESDNIESSMYLEPLEVDFWNKTGYDPRLIWDGFKMNDDNKVYYEIYENALKYLNDKMISSNKKLIKSVNESLNINDYVLIKNNLEYNLGKFNGEYIEIIRENIDIPKSKIEIDLNDRIISNQKKLEHLKGFDDSVIIDNDNYLLKLQENYEKYYKLFLKEVLKKDEYIEMNYLFTNIPDSKIIFENYIKSKESLIENEVLEYEGVDDYID